MQFKKIILIWRHSSENFIFLHAYYYYYYFIINSYVFLDADFKNKYYFPGHIRIFTKQI